MDFESVWNDQVPDKDGVKLAVNDIAISPDSSRLIAAVGNRVLLYKTADGDLIDSLRGHKDTVYSVSYSSDGSKFSSGGADNVVVIWKSSGQGLLKYNHSSAIQKVQYSPTQLLLLSCSEVDFGLWTPDQKQVTKEKTPSRILSACWSSDGSLFAVGLLNGLITVRSNKAEEILKFERKAPIWCLSFIPDQLTPARGGTGTSSNLPTDSGSVLEHADNLVVGCWDKTFTLYRLTSKNALVQSEKRLSFYPLSIRCIHNVPLKTIYFVVAGSNKQVHIYSREGIKLAEASKVSDCWIWSAAAHAEDEILAYGTNHGLIELNRLKFHTVHSLYRDRYAFRENLTEVIVHHLTTDKKVRIKCKDMIHNLSLFRNRLAVQLLDRVCIYESNPDDSMDIHFRLRKERISLTSAAFNSESKSVSNLMVVTSIHAFTAFSNYVELYSQDGLRQRIWTMDAEVRCLKVDGGQDGREGVIASLDNGAIMKFYVDDPFPSELTRRKKGIINFDVNIYRSVIATIDVENNLVVTETSTNDPIFTLEGVAAACFNSDVEDLLCITDINNAISVVSGLFSKNDPLNAQKRKPFPELHEQHIYGLVTGFRGQKIFAVQRGLLTSVDVPQGGNIQKALENDDFTAAYKIACLGATETDWRLLAMKALRSNQLQIAKNAYARLKDTKYLSLIEAIERGTPNPSISVETNKDVARGRERLLKVEAPKPIIKISTLEPRWVAEIMAYEGHYHEAAKLFVRSGHVDEAIKMFTLLRKWDEAKTFARNSGSSDVADLTVQQAKWLQETKDWKGSSDLYISMGQYMQAAKIIGEHEGKGWQSAMIEVVRHCPQDDKETIIYCAEKLSTMDDIAFAKESYLKLGDYSRIMSLYVQRQMWTEAAKLADDFAGKFDMSVFSSYAEWLVSQDRYEEAMDAFKKSGRLDLSRKVLTELTFNAVAEHRFKDAGYYYWMLAKELEAEMSTENTATSNDSTVAKAVLQSECEHKADLYYAYSIVYKYVMDPFTTYQPEMLFQVARFIINSLGISDTIPLGISKTFTLYTLAKQAMHLGAFKLARNAYDRLSRLKIPERKVEEVELDMLLVQAKPVRDDQDHLPVCFRCGTTNPLLNPFTNRFAKGDVCTNCGHPFVRSFINFEILPLVEFVPDPSISDDEAIEMIRQPPSRSQLFRPAISNYRNEGKDGADVYTLGEDADQSALGDYEAADLFSQCLNHTLERQKASYTPVQADSNTLLAMKRSEVFVCKPSSKNKRATFYKNMLPDIAIAISQPCHRFFHLEDFEFAYLSEKQCPYSRLKSVGEYGSI